MPFSFMPVISRRTNAEWTTLSSTSPASAEGSKNANMVVSSKLFLAMWHLPGSPTVKDRGRISHEVQTRLTSNLRQGIGMMNGIEFRIQDSEFRR
jgi:hypothetical protein